MTALCLVAGVGSASAQQGWVATLNEPVTSAPASQVRTAVDATGGITAVWTEGTPSAGYTVMASRLPDTTGAWDPPTALSAAGLFDVELAVVVLPVDGAVAMWSTSTGLYAARRAALTGVWHSRPIVGAGPQARRPRLAATGAGVAVAVWYLAAAGRIETARYDLVADTWHAAEDLGPGVEPDVTADQAGTAITVWTERYPARDVLAARFSSATLTWSAPVAVSAAGVEAWSARVAFSAAGDAIAVWAERDAGNLKLVRWARYDAATGAWAAASVLASVQPLNVVDGLALAGSGGELIAMWSELGYVHLRRYGAAAGSWAQRQSVTLPPVCPAPLPPCHTEQRATALDLAIDAAANGFATWQLLTGSLQATRISRDGALDFLETPRLAGASPQVRATAFGTATVTWTANGRVVSGGWLATPAAPVITGVHSQPGALTIDFGAPLTSDPTFTPVNYEYSLDDGAHWTPRVPDSVLSPMRVTGLLSGVPLAVRVRAVNLAGAGVASLSTTATAGPAPGPPEWLTTTAIDGRVVTFSWLAPSNSTVPTSYLLEAGLQPGQALAGMVTAGPVTTLSVVAPPGVFFVRARALADGHVSLASNEVTVTVAIPALPSAPAHLLAMVDDRTVALSWTNTFGGGATTVMWVRADGSFSGTMALPLGETASFPLVPPGTYTLRVAAANDTGISAASNAVSITVPGSCSGAPEPPLRMAASAAPSSVTVSWQPPDRGAAVTGYIVMATGDHPGTLSTNARVVSGAVPPGAYVFTVVAVNACGASAPSAPLAVTVP